MKVCIAQPEHLPWLGYFDKIAQADVFVFLDNVQFKKRYFENRNRIRTATGWIWVTVPVRSKGRFTQLLQDVEIDNDRDWQPGYWKSLELNYRRAEFFRRYRDFLEDTFAARAWKRLAELNLHLIRWAADEFGITKEFVLASALGVSGRASELLARICNQLGAKTYLSGISGREYLNEALFAASGIAIEYQTFHHPIYRQQYEPFEPCMAFVDLLLNHGPASRKILLDAQTERLPTVFT
jgi:hypothetical protein